MNKKMERAELINHLEHLAEYVKYSEDAPALWEAIALLKTHEERTETHVCNLIQRETARRIISSPRSKEQMLRMLEATPPAQQDHSADVSKMVNGDVVSRREAINGKISIQRTNGVEMYSDEAVPVEYLKALPPAQPEPCNFCKHNDAADDVICLRCPAERREE